MTKATLDLFYMNLNNENNQIIYFIIVQTALVLSLD